MLLIGCADWLPFSHTEHASGQLFLGADLGFIRDVLNNQPACSGIFENGFRSSEGGYPNS